MAQAHAAQHGRPARRPRALVVGRGEHLAARVQPRAAAVAGAHALRVVARGQEHDARHGRDQASAGHQRGAGAPGGHRLRPDRLCLPPAHGAQLCRHQEPGGAVGHRRRAAAAAHGRRALVPRARDAARRRRRRAPGRRRRGGRRQQRRGRRRAGGRVRSALRRRVLRAAQQRDARVAADCRAVRDARVKPDARALRQRDRARADEGQVAPRRPVPAPLRDCDPAGAERALDRRV